MITGTICSGKTTLAQRLSESLNINMISESNSGGFFGIIDRIKNNDFTPPVIIEHAEIYNLLNENREHEISKYFDQIIVILMNVSEDLLVQNLNDRKSRNVIGDYLNIDMLDMKKQIEEYFNETSFSFKYIADINTVDDYKYQYEKIMRLLSENICAE